MSLQATARACRSTLGLLAIVLTLLAALACGGTAGEPAASPTPEPTATPQSTATPYPKPAGPAYVEAIYSEAENTTRVNWDPVEGADWYHVYYRHHPFDRTCRIQDDGIPVRGVNCELAARNVVDVYSAEHLHELSSPSADNYTFFVSACNRGGCSVPVPALRR